MVLSLARKIVMATATGIVLGTVLFFIGTAVSAIVPNTPLLGAVGFVVGFGGAVAATISEDAEAQVTAK